MIIDKDQKGNITISELSPEQAELLQIAVLGLSEGQALQPDHERFLRKIAIQIDALLVS